MDALVEGIGMLIWLAIFGALMAYGIRNRGRIMRWLKNDNADNAEFDERKEKRIKLIRDKEDIEREIEEIDEAETGG